MSPIAPSMKVEPPATEGRWTFRSAIDFPAPPRFDNQTKIYSSGSTSGSSIPLDLSSLAGLSAGRAPPPPPIGGGGRYR
ncbi:hypothetical protein BGZ72_005959 [Mortierella alpina]|nr:hypothetical protein BGZ72_005959 [Mortierella alpina]